VALHAHPAADGAAATSQANEQADMQADMARQARATPIDLSALGEASLSNTRVGTPLTNVGPNSNVAYTYAPSAMYDPQDGKYKVWFGGTNTHGDGDAIWYSDAKSLDGPWSAPQRALRNDPGQFDSHDVCDPSVARGPDGTYDMYYGGAGHDTKESSRANGLRRQSLKKRHNLHNAGSRTF
jgi:hypothetical protein